MRMFQSVSGHSSKQSTSLLRRGSKGFFREDPLSNRRPRSPRDRSFRLCACNHFVVQWIYITNVRTSAEERGKVQLTSAQGQLYRSSKVSTTLQWNHTRGRIIRPHG